MSVLANKIIQIIIAIMIPFVFAGFIGYGSMKNLYPWMWNLKRPTWSPPSWVFGPVWTYLYTTMGIASWRIYNNSDKTKDIRLPLKVYLIQLFINVTWPQVYFNYHLMTAAAIQIIILTILVYITGILFYRVDSLAGYLIIPYAMWLTFATTLNVTIRRMNPNM
jgi:translocator protein